MKHFKFLAAIPVIMAFVLVSCNNGGDEKKTDTPAPPAPDSPKTTMTTAPVAPVKPGNYLVIIHKVANYTKWLPYYESGDSLKKANGLNNYVVGRGLGADSNTLLVAMKITDLDKAKAFSASADLKDRMKKSGVIGAPTVSFQENVVMDTPTIETKIRLMIMAKVKDWDAWKKEFDSHKQVRLDAGLTDRVIAHKLDDNHMVRLVFAVSDMAKAKAFMESKELKERMAASGVEGPPTIFYYTIAKKY